MAAVFREGPASPLRAGDRADGSRRGRRRHRGPQARAAAAYVLAPRSKYQTTYVFARRCGPASPARPRGAADRADGSRRGRRQGRPTTNSRRLLGGGLTPHTAPDRAGPRREQRLVAEQSTHLEPAVPFEAMVLSERSASPMGDADRGSCPIRRGRRALACSDDSWRCCSSSTMRRHRLVGAPCPEPPALRHLPFDLSDADTGAAPGGRRQGAEPRRSRRLPWQQFSEKARRARFVLRTEGTVRGGVGGKEGRGGIAGGYFDED